MIRVITSHSKILKVSSAALLIATLSACSTTSLSNMNNAPHIKQTKHRKSRVTQPIFYQSHNTIALGSTAKPYHPTVILPKAFNSLITYNLASNDQFLALNDMVYDISK